MFTLTRVHCDPAADHFKWFHVATLHRIYDVSQNVAFVMPHNANIVKKIKLKPLPSNA